MEEKNWKLKVEVTGDEIDCEVFSDKVRELAAEYPVSLTRLEVERIGKTVTLTTDELDAIEEALVSEIDIEDDVIGDKSLSKEDEANTIKGLATMKAALRRIRG